MQTHKLKRVMIIGASGSGKSTLARRLGPALQLPVIHIDPMYYTAGWVQRSSDETYAMIRQAIQAAEWIFEGNHSRSFDERAELADLIVVLRLGRVRRVARTMWRSLRYLGRTRPDMAPGCPERLEWDFHFNWVWQYDQKGGPKADAFVARWKDHRPIVQLTSAAEAKRFAANPLDELRNRGLGHLLY